jgi:hypothetical protein
MLTPKAFLSLKATFIRIAGLIPIHLIGLIAIFGTVIFFGMSLSKLCDPKFDTLPITNYCFAIMGGCASICFSWSRNIEPEYKKAINNITFCGERCFFSAICFVMASALKYFSMNGGLATRPPNPNVIGGMAVTSVLIFGVSLIMGLYAFYNILKLLFARLNNEPPIEKV